MKRSALLFAVGGIVLSGILGYVAISGEITGKTFAYDENAAEQGAAGNSRCPISFVRFIFHKVICSGASRPPAAVPELGR
jgi:hypothetical protein